MSHGTPDGVVFSIQPPRLEIDKKQVLKDQSIKKSKSQPRKVRVSEIKELIARGANINARDQDAKTPLMHAIQEKNYKVIKALIALGADLEAQDKDGKTALMYALESGKTDVIDDLIASGAKPDAQDKDSKTPLMYAIQAKNDKLIINALMAFIDINAQDKYGKTALMYALESGKRDVIYDLIASGAKLDAQDKDGKTAIDYYLRKDKREQNKEIIKLLRFGIENFDKTDLMLAIKTRDEKKIIALIASRVDLEAKDKDGKTALMHAAEIGDEKTIIALIDSGADLDAKDEYGDTAIYYAGAVREKLSQSLKIYRKAKEELSKVCAQEEGHTLSSILGKLDNFDELNSLAPFGLTEDKIAKAKIKFLLEVKDSAGKTPLKKLRQDAHTLDTDKLGSLKSKIEKLYQKDSNKNRKSELKRIVNKILKLITPKSILQRKKIDKMITRLQTSPIQSRPPQATSIPEQTTKMRGGRKK